MADIVTTPISLPIPSIAVDSGGLFTPGAAYSIQLNADIVNATWNLALDKSADFEARMAALTDLVTGWLATTSAPHISAGTITAPTPVEPSMTISDTLPSTVIANYSAQAALIVSDLVTKFSGFIGTYFPGEAANYGAAEAWVYDAITNTSTSAVPSAIKAAMLAQADAQIAVEKNIAIDTAQGEWLAKGHQFPPGALIFQSARIEQIAFDQKAEVIRSSVLKDFDLTYQKILEAVKMALANRQVALGAAQAYMVSMVSGKGLGNTVADSAHQAQTQMLNAAGGFYTSRVNASKLALDASQVNQKLAFDADKANQDADMEQIANRLKALLSEAQLLAMQTTALLNNMRAGGSSSYSVSA